MSAGAPGETFAHKVDVAIPAYNASGHLAATLDSVLAQQLPPATLLRIYVTDDASTDGLQKLLRDKYAGLVTWAVHPANKGRSAACNTAIGLGDGDVVVVLDADCRLADVTMIRRILDHLDAGADAVIGTVDAEGAGFWQKYAGVVSRRRVAAAKRDGPWHMTTANFAVRRERLSELNGFSERYRHYGFEDRDLLVRLARTGARVVVDERIVVLHREPASVREVCEKLYQSGRYPASEFAANFPDIYARSFYSHLDLSRYRKTAGLLEPVIRAFYAVSNAASDALIRSKWAGFGLQATCLRITSALGYLLGTCHAAREAPRKQPTIAT